MEVIKTIAELRRRLASEPRVACVPTMGNIHDGHLRLVGIAHEHASLVVTTIFAGHAFGYSGGSASVADTLIRDMKSGNSAGRASSPLSA